MLSCSLRRLPYFPVPVDSLLYAQLRGQALTLAATLRANGIRAGDAVAVMGPKTAEQVPALLGILAAGGVYLPIGVDQPRDRAAADPARRSRCVWPWCAAGNRSRCRCPR